VWISRFFLEGQDNIQDLQTGHLFSRTVSFKELGGVGMIDDFYTFQIVTWMIFITTIIWSILYFEWCKFKKNPEGYWKTMIELKKLKVKVKP
jgi:hypothetical protein